MGIVSNRRKDQELKVVFNDDSLILELDGKETAIPLLWYQSLLQASAEEKANWILSDDGNKLIWKNLNIEILI
ncbi:hypothetical protein A5893_12895 [Pedobacter psychrophilus]|uniref:DUF2442 domain-containing protein n=1 Tax=Pedobacter psychrophilus TaxID=1826909 RepID=A0A179DEK7_9SPHI|nr:DUF2442 domain-containing protein [Pedobacter psychrophilus]OAQ38929.1 hypothetical protein A5893_12895 [Pedobacter psychrophilus]